MSSDKKGQIEIKKRNIFLILFVFLFAGNLELENKKTK